MTESDCSDLEAELTLDLGIPLKKNQPWLRSGFPITGGGGGVCVSETRISAGILLGRDRCRFRATPSLRRFSSHDTFPLGRRKKEAEGELIESHKIISS